jgi:hypothetical protein
VDNRIPYVTLALSEAKLVMSRARVERARATGSPQKLAEALSDLAGLLTGRQALDAMQESVAIFRELAATGGESGSPDFAQALSNLSN